MVENQLLTPKLYVVGRHRRPKTARFSTKIVESEVCPPIFGACGAPWGAEEAEIGRELAFSPENTLNSRVKSRVNCAWAKPASGKDLCCEPRRRDWWRGF